jgi:hypothetical protein
MTILIKNLAFGKFGMTENDKIAFFVSKMSKFRLFAISEK